jgi:flavin reductase (DIM6/NTAB) family NADH-FMN oxidoreductase RutF
MARLLTRLVYGEGLRHLPIALGEPDKPLVRFELHGLPDGPRDITRAHVPVSLRPLVIGVWSDTESDDTAATRDNYSIVVRDAATGTELGAIDISRTGTLPLSRGTLSLFKTGGCSNHTAPASTRWWRYALAWIHARRSRSRGDRLCMTASDLRALNVYYMAARRVYLIGVASGGRTNLFPMDLVGSVGSGDFLLALRATSPAIEIMEASRVIAMSAAPADHLAEVYALGAHHKMDTVDVSALPFEVGISRLHCLPILPQGFVRELGVLQTHRVGSHVLFVCRVDDEHGSTPRQIAHVSAMCAEWLGRQGRAVEALA